MTCSPKLSNRIPSIFLLELLLIVSFLIFSVIFSSVRDVSRAAATSKMERFVIIVNGFQPLTIITKYSMLDVTVVLDPPLVSICKKVALNTVTFKKLPENQSKSLPICEYICYDIIDFIKEKIINRNIKNEKSRCWPLQHTKFNITIVTGKRVHFCSSDSVR